MVTEPQGTSEVELQRYGVVLWRRKWWVAAVAAGCAVVAAVAPGGGPARSYRSSADVLVTPILADPLQAPTRVDTAVDLETESRVLASTAVARIAAARLGGADPGEVAERVTPTVSPETQVMSVSFTAPSPAAAQAGAQAFAEAYLQYKADEARGGFQTITDGIEARKADLVGQLNGVAAALAAHPPESGAYIQAQSTRSVITSQISLLDSQLASYAAVDIDPGIILRPSQTGVPVRPRRLPVPLAGAMGLVAGMAVAFVRDRFDNRLHYTGNPHPVAALPLIAAIPRRHRRQKPHAIADPRSAGAEAYQRLATNVVAAHHGRGGIVVVTSPSPGEGKTTVSANIAVALARGGRRVAVVSADLRRPTLQRVLAVPPGSPTINDVLEGRIAGDRVGVPVPLCPNLTVYPSRPGTGSPDEKLQAPAMITFLERLRATHDYVIVDAPPVLPVADVLLLAAAATATILVGRQHRTRESALRDTAGELQRMGAHVIGVVLTCTPPAGTRNGYYAYSPAGRQAAHRRHELAVAATAAAVLVTAAGSAAAFNLGRPGRGSNEPALTAAASPAVLGTTLTRPPEPVTTTTVTTAPPSPPTTVPVTAPPTTATTRPPAPTSTTSTSTTTTTVPARITPASATAAGTGVSLTLEAAPGADGRKRSVTLRLTAGFTDGRVLRSVRIDYGDGKVVEPSVEEWACWAPGAPNPYVLTAPTRAYAATGTFPLTVTVTTAACSPDDDDWGSEESTDVRLALSVP